MANADKKLNRLMKVVKENYDGCEIFPWDCLKQEVVKGECGDTLLEFVVIEIAETYDEEADWEANVAEAARVMRAAEDQCRGVAKAFAFLAEK